MAIMVKDMNGMEQKVASNAKANAGLTLGIIGTALSALGGGNLLGSNVNPCTVTERQFYETELSNRDREFRNFQILQNQICDLAQRVSVNETANAYQNMLVDKEFECMDRQMGWDRIATGYQIQAATCKKIDGEVGLPVDKLTHGFMATDNYLLTYNGNCCGNPYNNW